MLALASALAFARFCFVSLAHATVVFIPYKFGIIGIYTVYKVGEKSDGCDEPHCHGDSLDCFYCSVVWRMAHFFRTLLDAGLIYSTNTTQLCENFHGFLLNMFVLSTLK
jgi:hypothetical protein